jgi:hypothetical protein
MLRVSIHAGPLAKISRSNRLDWLDIGYRLCQKGSRLWLNARFYANEGQLRSNTLWLPNKCSTTLQKQ